MAAQWSRLTGLLAGNEDAQLVDSHPDLSVHDFNLLVFVESSSIVSLIRFLKHQEDRSVIVAPHTRPGPSLRTRGQGNR